MIVDNWSAIGYAAERAPVCDARSYDPREMVAAGDSRFGPDRRVRTCSLPVGLFFGGAATGKCDFTSRASSVSRSGVCRAATARSGCASSTAATAATEATATTVAGLVRTAASEITAGGDRTVGAGLTLGDRLLQNLQTGTGCLIRVVHQLAVNDERQGFLLRRGIGIASEFLSAVTSQNGCTLAAI